jgi:hypothetical protein
MRLIGRYFAVGATLGSVMGFAALVLIWGWMTIHLGVLGFLLGWIPAGIAAATLWLAMVVFWGPILVVGTMIVMVLALFAHGSHDGWRRPRDEPPEASEPGDASSPHAEAPREVAPAPMPETAAPPPAESPLTPPAPPLPPSAAPTTPLTAPLAPAPTPPRARPSDDLGGDAAAAGDTSRKRPQ